MACSHTAQQMAFLLFAMAQELPSMFDSLPLVHKPTDLCPCPCQEITQDVPIDLKLCTITLDQVSIVTLLHCCLAITQAMHHDYTI
jgi:hypothetical protein